MSDELKTEVSGYRIVKPSAALETHLLRKVIPPRRGPTLAVPGLTLAESLLAGDAMFSMFGLSQYSHMVTAEMQSRPIPHVFPLKDVAALSNLFTEWQPRTMRWLMPQIEAPYQTYNNTSRTGYPDFSRPDSKLDYVLGIAEPILEGDLSMFEDGYIAMNVRLQVDPRAKKREFLFVDGVTDRVYQREITADNRKVRTPLGERTSSRTRLVFNLPGYNLVKQVWDTAVHNALLRWPAFHHDMFNQRYLPVRGYHMGFDVKHFERATAECNRIRAAMYGGVYAKCALMTARLPFAVPTDDWRGARLAYVDRAAGYCDQYASGDSAVAPSQKEILIAIYASFFAKEMGVPVDEAVERVALGGNDRLTIRNYGDDNSISGDKGACKAFYQYAAQYLHVQEEVPIKFLGHLWQDGKFVLGRESYLVKTYLPERAPFTTFRKFPYLGWVEKRKVYLKHGDAFIHEEIFPVEDDLLSSYGQPWYQVLRYADEERKRANATNSEWGNPLFVLEKDWAMTPEEKIRTGMFTGLTPKETLPILKKLVGPDVIKLLKI